MALASSGTPAPALLAHLRQDLLRHPPFSEMAAPDVDFFLNHAEQRYYAPDEVLVEPASGPVREIFYIRRGAVSGVHGLAELSGGAFQYEAGDLFPLNAAQVRRPVTATYRAVEDTFVLTLPCDRMDELSRRSTPFAHYLHGRTVKFLELSRRALVVAYASQALTDHSLETPLGELQLKPPVTCAPETPLEEALRTMHARRIGSIMVADETRRVIGILTRNDVLGRVALARKPLETPISEVMVQPVHTLEASATAGDAALLMSRHGIRHVPITRHGVVAGMVSERDLFALQRLSLKQVSTSIRSAPDVEALRLVAHDIRRFARSLLTQGVQARQLTALISHLNDVLTQRLLELLAPTYGITLDHLCWLALGSEGRSEQTIATDQDNALILPDGIDESERRAAQAFGRAVNVALDACGYPLCKGGVMAGEASCCLTLREWRERFATWIDHGAPRDLLNASIFFDFRPLAGDESLAQALRGEVQSSARKTPRFLHQMAMNALSHAPPLNWLGGVESGPVDLKLQGTTLFVDAARIYALAWDVPETNTRERLAIAGERMGLPAREWESWVGGFEFLQMLRLRVQLEGAPVTEPNRLEVESLNDIDRRMLRESLRMARTLQQRLRLDYER